jgi:hypothetical protein
VTIPHLYALYAGAYADSSHFHAERLAGRATDFARRRLPLTSIELAIVELAIHDATNGTPLRSPRAFWRALEHGGTILEGLVTSPGLRLHAG